jgi:hypothetical protein
VSAEAGPVAATIFYICTSRFFLLNTNQNMTSTANTDALKIVRNTVFFIMALGVAIFSGVIYSALVSGNPSPRLNLILLGMEIIILILVTFFITSVVTTKSYYVNLLLCFIACFMAWEGNWNYHMVSDKDWRFLLNLFNPIKIIDFAIDRADSHVLEVKRFSTSRREITTFSGTLLKVIYVGEFIGFMIPVILCAIKSRITFRKTS